MALTLDTTLAEVEAMCRDAAGDAKLEFRQSNREYELIDWIHEAIDGGCALVGTASQPLELLRVQPAGKPAMPAADWARGIDAAALPVLA